jgi:hypothetical protein
MTDLKYDYLFNENNHIVSHEEANSNNNYRLYKNEPLLYGYKESFERKNNVNVRGHFFLKTYNPMFTGTNESPEHYNAKMKIAKEKKYYDTIFETDVFFDEVVVEKQVLGNKRPDILCYNNNELVCIIEILYTNEKTQEDIEKLKLNNVPLIEIDIKNENKCKHLILPKILEANRQKYRIVKEEKSRIEKEYGRRIEELQNKIREIQEQSKGSIETRRSEINKIERRIDYYTTRRTETRRYIKSIKNEIRINESEITNIEKYEKQNRETGLIIKEIKSIKGNIQWQKNRSRQANTIIQRGF